MSEEVRNYQDFVFSWYHLPCKLQQLDLEPVIMNGICYILACSLSKLHGICDICHLLACARSILHGVFYILACSPSILQVFATFLVLQPVILFKISFGLVYGCVLVWFDAYLGCKD